MLSIGHRGAAGYAPENTIAAVEQGIRLGAQWVEVDVYCVEGELIVFHDDRLERTTNGTGLVMEQSFEYLRSLDAGDGQQIPTLQEVFDTIAQFRSLIGINIELKGSNTAEPVAAFLQHQSVEHALSLPKLLQRNLLAVSSFEHSQLQQLHQLNPAIPLGALFWGLPPEGPGNAIAIAQALSAQSINLRHDTVTAAIISAAHGAGLKVWAYTVNDPQDLSRMRSLGVDGVFTDYPGRVSGHVSS